MTTHASERDKPLKRCHPLPLGETRVLELSHVVAGPYTGLQLQLLGAQVTKVEPPGVGDFLNQVSHGKNAYEALNAGKEILRLDLGQQPDRERLSALAAETDVIIDSYSPGSLARKGLSYASLAAARPALIYCSISGYGTEFAPWGDRGAYDHVLQAMTGMAMLSGKDGDLPLKIGFPLIDTATGLLATTAILAALRQRDQSGVGQYLEISMVRTALALVFPMAIEAAITGKDGPRIGNRGYTGSPGAAFFECTDGWLSLGGNTAEQIARAARSLGAFTAEASTEALIEAMASRLKRMDVEAAEALMHEARVPAAKVRGLSEFVRLATANGLLQPKGNSASDWSDTLGRGWRCYGLEPGA